MFVAAGPIAHAHQRIGPTGIRQIGFYQGLRSLTGPTETAARKESAVSTRTDRPGDQTQSHRERLPVTHPRAPA